MRHRKSRAGVSTAGMRTFALFGLLCCGWLWSDAVRAEEPAAAGLPAAAPPPGTAPAAPEPAQAAGGESPSSSEYDDLVLRALAAYDAGRWDEARRLFEQAHGIDPTARTLRTIGMSAFNQNDFIAALQNLEAALIDTRKPLTDEQREHVVSLIERANHEVGRYRLRIVPSGATLIVDAKSPTLIGTDELVLLPGRHELRLGAEGYEPLTRKLDVKARDRGSLELGLHAMGGATQAAAPAATNRPLAPAPANLEVASERPPAAPAKATSGSRTAIGIVALSVGAGGLIASGVSLGIALSQKTKLDARCPERHCPYSEHALLDRYDTMKLVSGVTLGVGLAAAIAGMILLEGPSDERAEQAKIVPMIGPYGVLFRGSL